MQLLNRIRPDVLRIKQTIVLLIALAALFSCGKKKEAIVLAKVGDRIITLDEFRISYETSFAPLRRGASPRRTYLNHMINELLLAQEGYSQGLNKSHYVTSRVKRRKYNDLLEAFYKAHVHSRVNIPEQKIQDAVKKSTVNFRLMIWPVPSLEEAQRAYTEAKKTDLEDYINNQIAKQEIPNLKKEFFETDWMDYLEIPPDIFNRIKDLDLKKPSEPIPWQGGYAIIQVQDLQMHAITEPQLLSGPRRKKIEQRLFAIASDSISHVLMDSLLTPQNYRVKGEIFEQLAPLLLTWTKEGLPEKGTLLDAINAAEDTSATHLLALKELLDETLVSSDNGAIAVRDYIDYMNYYRRSLKQAASPEDFSNRLITEIGAMIKKDAFVNVARREGYEDSSIVADDLRKWEQKWTYELYRMRLTDTLKITDEEKREFFKTRWRELGLADVDTTRFENYEKEVTGTLQHEKALALINQKLAKLRQKYPVWINEAVLDTLTLDESVKSQQISLFLRKTFTGEQFAPTADPRWISN